MTLHPHSREKTKQKEEREKLISWKHMLQHGWKAKEYVRENTIVNQNFLRCKLCIWRQKKGKNVPW